MKKDIKSRRFNWGRLLKIGSIWVGVFLAIMIIAALFPIGKRAETSIPYSVYLQYLEKGLIGRGVVVIDKNEFIGTLKNKIKFKTAEGVEIAFGTFKTKLPFINSEVVKNWQEKGINIEFVEDSNSWLKVLGNFLPWLLLIGFWIFIARWIRRAYSHDINKLDIKKKAELIEKLIGVPPRYLIPEGDKILIDVSSYESTEGKKFYNIDPESGKEITRIQIALGEN